jgi:hypothetical protein
MQPAPAHDHRAGALLRYPSLCPPSIINRQHLFPFCPPSVPPPRATLAPMFRWLASLFTRKSGPPADRPTVAGFLDAHRRRSEPTPRKLMQELKGLAWTCASHALSPRRQAVPPPGPKVTPTCSLAVHRTPTGEPGPGDERRMSRRTLGHLAPRHGQGQAVD